mgnify:CR=1 FL=1
MIPSSEEPFEGDRRMTVEQKEDENSVGMEYTKEQTCLDCKHCNQCYKQRHQGSNKACDDIELVEW